MTVKQLKQRGYANKADLMPHMMNRYWVRGAWYENSVEVIVVTDATHWAKTEDGYFEPREQEKILNIQ